MRLVLVSFSFFLPSCFSFFFFFGGGGGGYYTDFSLGCSLHSVHAPPAATGYLAGEAGACVCSRVIDIFFHYAGARLTTCSRTRDLSKVADVPKS